MDNWTDPFWPFRGVGPVGVLDRAGHYSGTDTPQCVVAVGEVDPVGLAPLVLDGICLRELGEIQSRFTTENSENTERRKFGFCAFLWQFISSM